MGRVRRIPKERQKEQTEQTKSSQDSYGTTAVDTLNESLKTYLKRTLTELGAVNKGVESTVDATCEYIANNGIESWLDVFFTEFKNTIGLTEKKES